VVDTDELLMRPTEHGNANPAVDLEWWCCSTRVRMPGGSRRHERVYARLWRARIAGRCSRRKLAADERGVRIRRSV